MENEKSSQSIDEISGDISKLPEEDQKRLLFQLNQQNTQVNNNYGGMLPNPETLERFNRMVPGIAEKYFDDVFAESKFRRALINKQQNSDNKYRMTGIFLGWLFGLLLLLGSIFLIYSGHSVVGSLLTGTILLGALGIFVSDTNSDNKDK